MNIISRRYDINTDIMVRRYDINTDIISIYKYRYKIDPYFNI